jgi:ATP-binding cassette subfamily B (MDR/TAP) protein 1
MSAMMIVMSVGNTAVPIIAIAKAAGAAADFFAVIDAPRPSTDGLKDPQIAHGDIAFESVTFVYPSRPHVRILDDLSVRFPAGKLTAIVGASGSGKSTIVGLLERWYDLDAKQRITIPVSRVKTNLSERVQLPEEELKDPIPLSGSITLSGHNLQEIDLKFLRAQIGLVQQEPFLFNDSIFKNVEHGLVGTKWEDEDEKTKRALVEEACKEAFADEFINRLPQVGEFSVAISIMSLLQSTDLRAGIRYPSRRCRYQIKRRSKTKIGNSKEHHKTAQDSDSRRGHQRHRCPWRANSASSLR